MRFIKYLQHYACALYDDMKDESVNKPLRNNHDYMSCNRFM